MFVRFWEGEGRKIAGALRSLVNEWGSPLECSRVLRELLVVPVLLYGSETMLWKEKEIYRVWAVQMDNLIGLLGIRMMDRVPNAWIRELCGMKNGLNERINEGILQWFSNVEERITKKSL